MDVGSIDPGNSDNHCLYLEERVDGATKGGLGFYGQDSGDFPDE
jgi:hypothetical protein